MTTLAIRFVLWYNKYCLTGIFSHISDQNESKNQKKEGFDVMRKKLIAMAMALMCITSCATAGGVAAQSTVSENTGVSTYSETHGSVIVPYGVLVNFTHNLTPDELKSTKIHIVDMLGVTRQTFTAEELAGGSCGVLMSVHDAMSKNGTIREVVVESDKDYISTPLKSTGGRTLIDARNGNEVDIVIQNKGSLIAYEPVSRKVKVTLDTDLTSNQLKHISFAVKDMFGKTVGRVSAASAVANKDNELTLNTEDKGLYYTECQIDPNADPETFQSIQNAYIPSVDFDAASDKPIELTAKSKKPSNARRDIKLCYDESSGIALDNDELRYVHYSVYNASGALVANFTGVDAKLGQTINLQPALSAGANKNVFRITGEYVGAKVNVNVPEVKFVLPDDDSVQTVNVSAISGQAMAPAIRAVTLKFKDSFTEDQYGGLKFKIYDSFGRERNTWTGADVAAGKAYAAVCSDDVGQWRIETFIESGYPTAAYTFSDTTFDAHAVGADVFLNVEPNANYDPSKETIMTPVLSCGKWSEYVCSVIDLLGIKLSCYDSSNKKVCNISSSVLRLGKAVVKLPDSTKAGEKFTIKIENLPDGMLGKFSDISFTTKTAAGNDDTQEIKLANYFTDKNFYRTISVVSLPGDEISVNVSGKAYSATCDRTVLGMGTTTIDVPISKSAVIRDDTVGYSVTSDTTADTAISLVTGRFGYEVYLLDSDKSIWIDTYLDGTKTDNFVKDGNNSEFLDDLDRVAPSGWYRVDLTVGTGGSTSDQRHSFYWMPARDGSLGMLYDADAVNRKAVPIIYKYLNKYLVKNMKGLTRQAFFMFDRNYDGKLNVFDSIMYKREIIKNTKK